MSSNQAPSPMAYEVIGAPSEKLSLSKLSRFGTRLLHVREYLQRQAREGRNGGTFFFVFLDDVGDRAGSPALGGKGGYDPIANRCNRALTMSAGSRADRKGACAP